MSQVKQVIVIRKDLGMRRGKEIAQGAHASMLWLINRMNYGRLAPRNFDASELHCLCLTEAEKEWVGGSYRKIVCQVKSLDELMALFSAGKQAGIESHIVTDLGATEFNGVSTVTALAIGPDLSHKIDPITASLALY